MLTEVLMVLILAGGLYSSFTLVREMFPESRPDKVRIVTPYPGATPAEVEKGITQRIEEAIKNIEHIDRIETQVSEGLSTIVVTMTSEADDINDVVNEFKAAVDAIPRDDLPEEAEETRVTKFEPMLPVISIGVYGDVDEGTMKDMGRAIRDDLLLVPGITDVIIEGTRKSEIAVEVEPEKLIEYGISMSEVSSVIRQTNLDLPGGQVRTAQDNVAVRTLGETDDVALIRDTVIRTSPAGEAVRVRDLGRVIDTFEDVDLRGRFNGKRAVSVTVFKTGEQDAIDIANKVRAYIAGRLGQPMQWPWTEHVRSALGLDSQVADVWRQASHDPLRADLKLQIHSNLAHFIEDRLELLTRNGLYGLILVFLSLLFFLNFRIAFWVAAGMVTSICGAIMFMDMVGASLNLISMFGLIVVLGLLVDDAIVVGESVYARIEAGEDPKLAAIKGTEKVTWPVIIAVATTIAAFLPLMFIEGQMGDFMGVLPVVVACALSVSLLEALSILPSHLAKWLKPISRGSAATAKVDGGLGGHPLYRRIRELRYAQRDMLHTWLGRTYEKLLRLATQYRYVTTGAVVAALIVSVGLIAGGKVPFVFIQKMDSETIVTNIEMPVGTPIDRTSEVMGKVEQAVLELPPGELQSIWSVAGSKFNIGESGVTATVNSHLAQCIIELSTIEARHRTSEEIIAELRSKTNDIPGAESIRYLPMQGGPGGAEIEIEVTGERLDDLVAASAAIKAKLAEYRGVFDIDDSFEAGRRELQIELLDSARSLGLTTQYLATEVRGGFYGLEPRTLQRNREDVDIRVRFPENRREHIHELEAMRIITPQGRAVPLTEVARVREGRGFSSIQRVDQRRAVTVSADVDQAQGNTSNITAAIDPYLRQIEEQYPGLRIRYAGQKLETAKSVSSLKRDFLIALALVYVMLAGLFRSYIQGLIVLIAVPFGLNGAVAGHFIMGYPLTILSLIGLVALTGIAVNDALIMVDFINREIADGKGTYEAVIEGGKRRLRPIILTSLTTILGLAPLMMETSFQARFLIPMAISISFGLMFSTVLTLLVVPSLYLMVYDLQRFTRWLWHGRFAAEPVPPTA